MIDAAALTPTITCPACNGRTTITNEDGWGRDHIAGCEFCHARGSLPRSEAHGILHSRLRMIAKMPYVRWEDDWKTYVRSHPEEFNEHERALIQNH
jgi:hypothetical protein